MQYSKMDGASRTKTSEKKHDQNFQYLKMENHTVERMETNKASTEIFSPDRVAKGNRKECTVLVFEFSYYSSELECCTV